MLVNNNINFIPANELPEAEGDEVSVLCIENGELKQKAASGLGGGGEKTDMVIALTAPFSYGEPESGNTTVAIESGSLEAVAEALREGRPPVVKCKRYHVTNGFDTSYPILEGGVYDCDVYYYSGWVHFSFCVPRDYMMRITMDINDPDFLEVWLHPLMMTGWQVI